MRHFFLYTCLLLAFSAFSQVEQGLIIGADYHYGELLKHSQKQTFEVPNAAYAIAFEVQKQTNGSKYWHKAHHFPRFGFGLMYKNYGNDNILGQALTFYPQLDVFIWRKKNFRLTTRLAFGFAYLNRPYDRFTNPQNTAIGSRFNNYTMLGLAAEYDISPDILMRIGGNLSHSSNGHLRTPNLGLNTLCAQVGLHYRFAADDIRDTLQKRNYLVSKKIRFGLRTGFAMKEGNLPDGPFYPIYVFSPYLLFPHSAKRQWLAGFQISTEGENIAWKKDNEKEGTYLDMKTHRISVFGGHEVLWGKVGFMSQLHFYLDPPLKGRSFFFTIIGPTYHFQNPQKHPRFNAYIGLYLKAHYATADYADGVLGISF